jgi:hypothetical protein
VEAEGLSPSGVLCESSIDSREYSYRYINLRLLVTSADSYILVPMTWTEDRGIVIIVKKSDVFTAAHGLARPTIPVVDWIGGCPY